MLQHDQFRVSNDENFMKCLRETLPRSGQNRKKYTHFPEGNDIGAKDYRMNMK